MAGLFSHAIAAFQGFFSRGFWFGAFLPVAMFIAVNLFLAWLAGFDWAAQAIGQVVAKDWVWAVPLAAALIVVAYALAPLVEVCRAVLDGRRLPTLVFEWLRGEAYARKNAALARLAETDKYLARTQGLRELVGFRPPSPGGADRPAGEKRRPIARLAVRFLEARVASGNRPNRLTLWIARRAVAGIRGGLETRVRDALDKADDNARDRRGRLQERYDKLPREPQPTRAGEGRYLSELYSQNVYAAEFAFLWPRVQMVIEKDDPSIKRIEVARALADFSVLSLMLAAATLVVWLPLLAFTQREPWSFLALGIGGPFVVRFFYQLVVASQIGLGEVAQGIVDRFRFEVLKMLHIKPPATLAAEREIWFTLAAIARGQSASAATARRESVSPDMVWTAPPT